MQKNKLTLESLETRTLLAGVDIDLEQVDHTDPIDLTDENLDTIIIKDTDPTDIDQTQNIETISSNDTENLNTEETLKETEIALEGPAIVTEETSTSVENEDTTENNPEETQIFTEDTTQDSDTNTLSAILEPLSQEKLINLLADIKTENLPEAEAAAVKATVEEFAQNMDKETLIRMIVKFTADSEENTEDTSTEEKPGTLHKLGNSIEKRAGKLEDWANKQTNKNGEKNFIGEAAEDVSNMAKKGSRWLKKHF